MFRETNQLLFLLYGLLRTHRTVAEKVLFLKLDRNTKAKDFLTFYFTPTNPTYI